jgi:FtsP/CotA-like multicopper oxidase with cupredoxin domain
LPGDPEGNIPTGQMVRIKAEFKKTGRYVWHCHILSHEDHEMMRVLQVG